jgi:hypothetical protein
MDSKYPKYGPEVNAILDTARAARQLERTTGTPAGNVIQTLEKAACNWWWSLIDIVLDHEETQSDADAAPIKFVPVVTHEHAEKFADDWFSEASIDADDATGIMKWPKDEDARARYHAIHDEICERIFADVREPIIQAFLRAATEVLDSERSR